MFTSSKDDIEQVTTVRLSSSNDNDMDAITHMIADMSGTVEAMLAQSLRRVCHQNSAHMDMIKQQRRQAAKDRHAIDLRILSLCSEVKHADFNVRRIIALGHIAAELERITELSTAIAAPLLSTNREDYDHYFKAVASMEKLVKAQLKTALDALLSLNSQKAVQAWLSNADIHEMHTALLKEHLTLTRANICSVNLGAYILHVSKTLEKIADCSKNIAESVYEISTGQTLAAYRLSQGVKRYSQETVS